VFIADIAKMYQQILIDSRGTDYQRIVWQSTSGGSITDYRLLIVTYSTAAAPYLALRILEQLVDDEDAKFPLAVPVYIVRYMLTIALLAQTIRFLLVKHTSQLIELLKKGDFRVRKWESNATALLSELDLADHSLATHKILQDNEHVKVLGIL